MTVLSALASACSKGGTSRSELRLFASRTGGDGQIHDVVCHDAQAVLSCGGKKKSAEWLKYRDVRMRVMC